MKTIEELRHQAWERAREVEAARLEYYSSPTDPTVQARVAALEAKKWRVERNVARCELAATRKARSLVTHGLRAMRTARAA